MWFRTLILAGSLAVFATATPAMAEPRNQIFEPNYFQPAQARGGHQDILSVREVAEILRSRYGGQLNNARLEGGDRPFYVIRWEMPNGDFRDFTVDAVSGQVR
jgi:uncharacterized membrane protein YkoI